MLSTIWPSPLYLALAGWQAGNTNYPEEDAMTGRRPLLGWTTALLATSLVWTGCAGPATEAPSPAVEAPATTTPNNHDPSGMTPNELFRLAAKQYQKLFDIMASVETDGGALQLPDEAHQYAMDPAFGAINDMYREMYFRGEKYLIKPELEITAIGTWDPSAGPSDAITAIRTCEAAGGGTLLTSDGSVLRDEGIYMASRRGYFKIDPADGQLKVFVLNGEGVKTCPIS